ALRFLFKPVDGSPLPTPLPGPRERDAPDVQRAGDVDRHRRPRRGGTVQVGAPAHDEAARMRIGPRREVAVDPNGGGDPGNLALQVSDALAGTADGPGGKNGAER